MPQPEKYSRGRQAFRILAPAAHSSQFELCDDPCVDWRVHEFALVRCLDKLTGRRQLSGDNLSQCLRRLSDTASGFWTEHGELRDCSRNPSFKAMQYVYGLVVANQLMIGDSDVEIVSIGRTEADAGLAYTSKHREWLRDRIRCETINFRQHLSDEDAGLTSLVRDLETLSKWIETSLCPMFLLDNTQGRFGRGMLPDELGHLVKAVSTAHAMIEQPQAQAGSSSSG